MLRCSLCIHDERTGKIDIVDGKPLCRECQDFLAHPPNKEKIRKELDDLMNEVDRAILGFSGGKDSSVALYLAKEKYRVDVEAVMIDNGFIAKEAIENAKRVAEYLNVPLTILRYDYSDIFRTALLKAQSPCRACSKRTMEKLRKYALKKGIRYILTGHEIPFGHHPYRHLKGGILQIRLLTLMNEEERFRILKKLPFKFPELHGYTTNCLIIGAALERYYERRGYSFETRRIAALVRYGLMDRKRALEKVKKPEIPVEMKLMVYEKLGIKEEMIK
ncbi:MAG: 7-cyano-7-deazaguanine synthase [Palaeococcus sp.]|uniref:7-cyano-7-deazaguanine synthase n=1 Tax=Palaeococcus sp. (in: euryarchaeotes) TaxID=2820298 RepID=UPI0025D87289|nr:7-cyano-7-deazaguanine synthase [Palaeococcus sp. (in: euryarchaeotes)]MCD6559266.1 7-cyano-7-deazaguanine synthase [Palaeococcus sp. (in: euryarchaeotes)]